MPDRAEPIDAPLPAEDAAASRAETATRVGPAAPDMTTLAALLRGPRTVLAVATVGTFFLGCIAFLYFARSFILPVVLALILNFLLKPVVRLLARIKLPEPAGAAIVLAVVLFAVGSGVSTLSGPARDWARKAPEGLRKVERKIRHVLHPAGEAQAPTAAPNPREPTKPTTTEPGTSLQIQTGVAESILSNTTTFLGGMVEILVLLYFFLASGDMLMNKVVKVLPTRQNKNQALQIVDEVQRNISAYLSIVTIINACLGLVVGTALYFLKVPNPLLWGVLAGLLNFIPYLGPFTITVVMALVGLLTYEAMGEALLPPLVYLGVHALESNFITPTVLGRRLTLNPVVIFVSLIFWTWLWGIPGALLAVPLLMTVKIVCDHVTPLAPISEFLSQ